MTDALLLVDVLKDFRHEDGDTLLESYRRRHPVLISLLSEARAVRVPVVYANDRGECAQPGEVVHEAVEEGKAGELVAEVAPAKGEPVLLKDAYSAFEGTELPAVLAGLGVERVLVAGTATEMCVFQTALDAQRSGFDVLVRGDASASLDNTNEGIALDYLERVLGLEVVRALKWRERRVLSARASPPLRVRLFRADPAPKFRGSRGFQAWRQGKKAR